MGTMAGEAQPRLHAVYRETVYELGMLGWHFAAIQAAWPHLLLLATLCTHQDEDPEARVGKILQLFEEPTIYFARDQDWQRWYRAVSSAPGEPAPIGETIGDLAERQLTVLRAPELTFERIQLDSRLEFTLAAAGRNGVIIYDIYALHLLCAFLQNPDRIDGWLPRLVAGWHKARRDAEIVRQEHRDEVGRGQLTDLLMKQHSSRLKRLAQNPELHDLHPVRVTLVGAEDQMPEDIRAALQAQPD